MNPSIFLPAYLRTMRRATELWRRTPDYHWRNPNPDPVPVTARSNTVHPQTSGCRSAAIHKDNGMAILIEVPNATPRAVDSSPAQQGRIGPCGVYQGRVAVLLL